MEESMHAEKHSRVELATNVSIMIAMVCLTVVLVKNYIIQPRSQSEDVKGINVGDVLKVDGIDWSKGGRTLVLALNKDCHFCNDSAPFYQRLGQLEGKRTSRLVALMPHDRVTSEQYLKSKRIDVDDVVSADLFGLHIPWTPALLLVDQKGMVTKLWKGRLAPEKEQEVVRSIEERLLSVF